ncbi:hypothetical protein [Sulfidibacter corallicola]|uniref:Sortilin N-terminal domain-containing protein n=1 Tax=Sulfidibacter corallicola TaxID=2818388 RepID=A0A8A4TEJ7_SULCO|nr:hypothetical protein [Sulfidibacter corallicola]QTD47967.1 hypothetical protein J3U87_20465 [Sulfidibacter corallicola]
MTETTKPGKPKTPGSYNGLISWHKQRAYPHEALPKRGFTHAFDKVRNDFRKATTLHKDADPWQSVPAGLSGRTLALAFHPTRPDTLFAGSASGGLWRTDSATSTPRWSRVPTGFPVQGVAAIAINPDNPDQMMIGTGEVYGFEETFPGYARRETRGSYGIGILISEDGGQSWSMSLDWRTRQDSGVQALTYDPRDARIVWAATTDGIYRSDDGGTSWDQVHSVPMATSLVLFPNHPGRVLAACGGFASPGHGLYLSEDDGATWTKITGGLPETFGGKAILHASKTQPDLVYASIGNGHTVFARNEDEQGFTPPDNATWLCRSTDGGRTWTQVNDRDYSLHQGWYSHFVFVDPADPTHLILGGVSLHVSYDSGTQIDFGVALFNAMADFHALVASPHDPSLMFLAADQGIATSQDGGESWETANLGYHSLQFFNGMAVSPHAPNPVMGTAQDINGSLRLDFDGDTPYLFQQYYGHEAGYVVIDPRTPDTFMASGPFLWFINAEGIGGTVTSPPNCSSAQPDCYELDPSSHSSMNAPVRGAASNPDVIYAGRDVVWRSDNLGRNWTATNDGLPLGADPLLAMEISPHDENLVYVATAPNKERLRLFKTVNGGQSWIDITGNLPDRYVPDLAIDPNDDQTVYAVLSGYGSDHLYRTRDGGTTWESVDRGRLPDVPTTAITIDPQHPDHLYIGNDLGVFVSLDSGYSWFSLQDGLPEAVLVGDLIIDPEKRLLYLGSHGNGLFYRSLLDPMPKGASSTLAFAAVLPEIHEGRDATTRVGLVNPADGTTAVRIDGFTAAGGWLGTSAVVTELAANQSTLRDVAELFPDLPSAVRWIRIESDTELIAFAELNDTDTRSAYLAPNASTSPFLPHVARDTAQFSTELVAVNPGADGGTGTLQAFPSNQTATPNGLGPEFTRSANDLNRLFDGDLDQVFWARLDSDQPLVAMERFSRLPGRRESAALGLDDRSGQELRLLHVATDTSQFWTGLVYINTGAATANVTEEAFDAAGNLISSQTLSVAPSGKETLLFDADTIQSGNPRISAETAWLRVRSDQPLIGYELFGAPTSSGNEVFAGLQGNTASAARLIYPYVRSDARHWTGIVAVNTDEAPVAAEARLLDASGQVVARADLGTLNPGQKATRLVRDLFPGADVTGGQVNIVADRPVLAGFQLWGDHNTPQRKFLAGISAIGR